MEKAGFFTSKQWDEDVELYYFNARWYDPETGRFITEDPIRDGTGWYNYVGNNPMGFVDPTGLMKSDTKSAAAASHAASNPGAGFGSGGGNTSPNKESRPEGGGPKHTGWSYGKDGWTRLKGGLLCYHLLWGEETLYGRRNKNNKTNYSSLPGKPDKGMKEPNNTPGSPPNQNDEETWLAFSIDADLRLLLEDEDWRSDVHLGKGVNGTIFLNTATGEMFYQEYKTSIVDVIGPTVSISANVGLSVYFYRFPAGTSSTKVANSFLGLFTSISSMSPIGFISGDPSWVGVSGSIGAPLNLTYINGIVTNYELYDQESYEPQSLGNIKDIF